MKKEEWIDAVLQSTKGQQMAELNAFLHTRVMQVLHNRQKHVISYKWVFAMCAGMALLCVLNVRSVRQNSTVKSAAFGLLLEDYGLSQADASLINY